jgi:hypothetical protein
MQLDSRGEMVARVVRLDQCTTSLDDFLKRPTDTRRSFFS